MRKLNTTDEAKLREGDRSWGAGVDRSRVPMDKKQKEGGVEQGERARNREPLVIKAAGGTNLAVVQRRRALLAEA